MLEGNKITVDTTKTLVELDHEVSEKVHNGPVRIGISQLLTACERPQELGFKIDISKGDQFLAKEAEWRQNLQKIPGTSGEMKIIIELMVEPLKYVSKTGPKKKPGNVFKPWNGRISTTFYRHTGGPARCLEQSRRYRQELRKGG